MDSINYGDDDQIQMLNGRCVMNAFAFLNYEATESELLEHVTTTSGHPQNVVKQELKRILDFGVSNGFIMKNGNRYLLPRWENVHQVDGPPSGTQKQAYRVHDENGDYLYLITFEQTIEETSSGEKKTRNRVTLA